MYLYQIVHSFKQGFEIWTSFLEHTSIYGLNAENTIHSRVFPFIPYMKCASYGQMFDNRTVFICLPVPFIYLTMRTVSLIVTIFFFFFFDSAVSILSVMKKRDARFTWTYVSAIEDTTTLASKRLRRQRMSAGLLFLSIYENENDSGDDNPKGRFA